jgi:hypothetical protein
LSVDAHSKETSWYALITSYVNIARLDVDVLVVLGLEEVLELLDSNICLNPLLVDALRNVLDTVGLEPCTNDVDGRLLRGEHLDDFLRREVLTEAGAVMARAGMWSVYSCSEDVVARLTSP